MLCCLGATGEEQVWVGARGSRPVDEVPVVNEREVLVRLRVGRRGPLPGVYQPEVVTELVGERVLIQNWIPAALNTSLAASTDASTFS